MSIEDRPAWFDGQVCILAEDFWPRDNKENQIFDLTLLDSQEWCLRHCIKAGTLEVLDQYGVHNHLGKEELDGHSAVVYIDSPLLKSCNIIDFPGYSDQSDQISEDVKKANSAVQIADLIVYTSPVNGFMSAEDFSRLGYLMRILPTPENHWHNFPTLGNLFIVATHAAPHIPDTAIESVLKIGARRFYKQIESSILEERSKSTNCSITVENFDNCFFAFWEETPQRWISLKNKLASILCNHLPKARQHQIDQEIDYLKYKLPEKIAEQIRAYEQTKNEVEERKKDLQELEEQEISRTALSKKGRRKVDEHILYLYKQTKESFRQVYSNTISINAVENIIREHYANKKDAQQYAVGYLLEQLQGNLEDIIKDRSNILKEEINKFLGTYEEIFIKLPKLNLGSVSIPFDPKGAFIGGLAGLGGVGALAIWAASLGNLGAYILVAKAVSLLSLLGISISGGVATAVAFVATIGGPITLAVGLVAAAATIGWALFGGSWQHSLAKQIVSHLEKQQVIDKFIQGVDEYWLDTAQAFDKGANAVEEEYQGYIQHLRELCSNDVPSKELIEGILHKLKELKDFFCEIPYRSYTE